VDSTQQPNVASGGAPVSSDKANVAGSTSSGKGSVEPLNLGLRFRDANADSTSMSAFWGAIIIKTNAELKDADPNTGVCT